jgi:hypothetical protein
MANLFDSMMNNLYSGIAQNLSRYLQDPIGRKSSILEAYFNGDQRRQLKTAQDPKTGQEINDNVILNNIGLVVQRSTSRLFKGGVKFKLPEGSDAQQEYLDRVWDLNKKEIILFHNGLLGATHGTVYFKIVPDGILDPYTGQPYPRLIPISHRIIRVKTHPEDVNEVEEYRIEYVCNEERNGRMVDVTHREITKHPTQDVQDGDIRYTSEMETWVIETWEQVGGAPFQMTYQENWNYNFPPIIHWQNLPVLEGVYGDSEIDDLINPQDKINFTVSNTGKIIKFHASPTIVLTGTTAAQVQAIDAAIGQMMAVPDKDAKVQVLEAASDLASSRLFAQDLKDDLFNIAREPNVSIDKMGAFTNFALRILYADALDKNDTKRQLYGDALLELNRRLLVLAGYTGEASRPGTIQWGEVLPINATEELAADKVALDMGIIDKESLAAKWFVRYGVDWETIQANNDKNKPDITPDVMPQDNTIQDNQKGTQDANMSDMQPQRQAGDSQRLS